MTLSGSTKHNNHGKKSRKLNICETKVFPICEKDHVIYEHDKPHFLFEGVTQEQVLSIFAARDSETLNSQLEAELSTFVQGNPCLMPLSRLLWVFLAITFSGRDASKPGCESSG